MSGPACRRCGADLIVGENWFPGFAKTNRLACKTCHYRHAQAARERDPEAFRARQRAWAAVSRDKHREAIRARDREHAKKNAPYYAAKEAARRARKARQMLPTSNRREMRRAYELARTLSDITGGAYHVDHLHPLSKGGAHHQDNLVAMRADFNLKKSDDLYPALIAFFSPNVANTRT